MGILSVLGKLGKGALNVATGGVGGTILDAISGVGGALGKGAQGAAAGRRSDAMNQAQMNALNNRALLDAGEFNLAAPSTRTSQVARGDVLSTMQDAAPTGDARVDKFGGGGLRPSAFGAASRQAGDELKRQALMALMSGSDKITPQMSQMPKSGMLEKLGGIAGLAGGVAGALGEVNRRRSGDTAAQTGGGLGGQTGAPQLPFYQPPQAQMGQRFDPNLVLDHSGPSWWQLGDMPTRGRG